MTRKMKNDKEKHAQIKLTKVKPGRETVQQGPQWHNFAPVYDYCQHIHDENMMMMPDVDDDGCLL